MKPPRPKRFTASTDDTDRSRDIPCFIFAFALHAFLLSSTGGFDWSIAEPKEAQAAALPVEFVHEIPTASLAPIAPGNGKKNEEFHKGPGPIKPKLVKKGHPKPKLTAAQKAALQAKKAEALRKKAERLAEQKRRRAEEAARREEIRKQKEAERQERLKREAEIRRLKEIERQQELERQREIRRQQEAERQRILAEKKAAAERAAAERRAAAEQAAAERRAEAERVAEEMKAAEDKRKALLAEKQRIAAARKAELEQELATVSNPDEALSKGDGNSKPSTGISKGRHVGLSEGLEAGAGRSALLASAAPAAAPADDNGEDVMDGQDGRDAINQKASGGGFGVGDGGPVSYALDGPAGNRRLLKRIIPDCPDWVSQRGLDLVVQLRFRVLENGTVKETVIVKKTSGFPALDQLAIEALRKWKFQPYTVKPGEKTPDVWGVISLRFVAS